MRISPKFGLMSVLVAGKNLSPVGCAGHPSHLLMFGSDCCHRLYPREPV